MIYVGIDDTDTLDDPGTNQLARHLVKLVAARYRGCMITRHQLLDDPRVPCTSQNGCAAIVFEPREDATADELWPVVRAAVLEWSPPGSDPGLCMSEQVPPAIVEWGERCQRQLVRRQQALDLAAVHGIRLEGLGGTCDGVIGALAAIGLVSTGRDGRVIHIEASGVDLYDVSGMQQIERLSTFGVEEVRCAETGRAVTSGLVDVGKRLRPNLRDRRVVLLVEAARSELNAGSEGDRPAWQAVRAL